MSSASYVTLRVGKGVYMCQLFEHMSSFSVKTSLFFSYLKTLIFQLEVFYASSGLLDYSFLYTGTGTQFIIADEEKH